MILAREPIPWPLQQTGTGLVHIHPLPIGVKDLKHHVLADRHGDAGVEEVARIDHHRLSAMLGLKGTQRGDQIVDRAVTLEQVHVFHPAKAPLQGGGKDDDGHFRPAPAQNAGHLRTELARAQMVIEHGDVDLVDQLLRFADGARSVGYVTVLAQDGGSKEQIFWIVV